VGAVRPQAKPELERLRHAGFRRSRDSSALEALQGLPEHATIEEAIEQLCFIAKIEEDLRQSDARQLVSHDEVEKQFLS
jgi:hypothetical protein